jgi:hypothetical protein
MVTVAGVNPPHTSFTVRQCPTVKEVRFYSDWSCWNSSRHALLQRGRHGARHIGGTTVVCSKPVSEAEARAGRWLRSRLVLWSRRGLRPRPGARARRSLRPRPEGSGETESASEAGGVRCSSYSFLSLFIPLIWVSYFMVPNPYYCRLLQNQHCHKTFVKQNWSNNYISLQKGKTIELHQPHLDNKTNTINCP